MASLDLERLLPLVAAIALAIPVLAFAYPPMTDLPHHEAVVAILRDGADAVRFPPGLYVRNFGHPNQLFQLTAWPLSYALGVTLACRVVIAAAVAAVVLGGARLARHLGASTATALLLAPFAMGWLFYWGLMNNLLGLGVLLALLPELDAVVSTGRLARAARLFVGTLVLYLAHELMLFVLLAACVIFAIVAPPDASKRGRFMALGNVAAMGAVIASQFIFQEHLKSATVREIPNTFPPPWTKLPTLLADAAGAVGAGVQIVLALLFVVAIAVVVEARRRRAAANAPPPALRARLHGSRYALVSAVVFIWYFFGPATFNGATLVYQRFLAPACALAVLPLAVDLLPGQLRTLRFVGAGAVLVTLAAALPSFADSSRDFRDLGALLPHIAPGSAVAGLALHENKRPFALSSMPSRVVTERGGRVHHGFVHSTVSPVMLAPEFQWGESAVRIKRDAFQFRPAFDLTRYRYVLLRSDDPLLLDIARLALLPDARTTHRQGAWVLAESVHSTCAVVSPDAPLPSPPPASLADRARTVEERLRGAPAP